MSGIARAVTGLFGGGSPSTIFAPAPAPEPVPVMPTPDDEAVKAARRKSIAAQRSRRGRASTIFTEDPLGG